MAASSSSSEFAYSNPPSYFPVPFHLQQPPTTLPTPPLSYPTPTPTPTPLYLPQFHQAQQLFQKDAQIITPEALKTVKAALATTDLQQHKPQTVKKPIPRKAAGQTWEDPTLADWPENDFRLFCGDLGNEVVRDKRTGKTKGYGFVSFANAADLASALKEMNGKYVGNRPIKLRKSNWKDRTDFEALEKQKQRVEKKSRLPKKSVLHK